MPDVITKMYIKPYDILSYASKGIFIPIEDYIEEDMPNLDVYKRQSSWFNPSCRNIL